MQFNRIQHFIYTNNHPKGLNYETAMLRSLVYHEGAEYPFLPPELPNYVGKSKDSLTKMLTSNPDEVSQACLNDFENTYCNFEDKLAGINKKIIDARDTFIKDISGALVDWVGILRDIFPLPELYENFINSLAGTTPVGEDGFDIKTDPNYIIAIGFAGGFGMGSPGDNPIFQEVQHLLEDLLNLDVQFQKTNSEFIKTRKRIAQLEAIRRQVSQQSVLFDIDKELKTLRAQANRLGATLNIMRDTLRSAAAELLMIVKNNPQLFGGPGTIGSVTADFRNTINFLIKTLMGTKSDTYFAGENFWRRGSVYLPTAEEWLKLFSLLGTAVGAFIIALKAALIALGVLIVAAGIYAVSGLISGLGNLKQQISQACAKWERTVRSAENQRAEAAKEYYESLQIILNSGCCDKGSGGCNGGSNSGSGSGSCVQGVGLTLLMGNKYIPTYYDNINENYLNTNEESVIGKYEFKPNCPPMPGSPYSANCVRCKTKVADETNSSSGTVYDKNTWSICTDPVVTIVGNTTDPNSPVVSVQNHTCACGWPRPDKPAVSPCDFVSTFYQGFESLHQGLIDYVRTIISDIVVTGGE